MNIFLNFFLLPIILYNITCSLTLFALEIKNIEGVYKHRFTNALMDGRKYESEDILEIVKYTDSSIYLRVHLDFMNGHECNFWGIAKQKNNSFFYQNIDNTCHLSLKTTERELVLDDESNEGCQILYCGARGTLHDVHFKKKWQRKIKYMPLILKSRQYQNATEEYSLVVESKN